MTYAQIPLRKDNRETSDPSPAATPLRPTMKSFGTMPCSLSWVIRALSFFTTKELYGPHRPARRHPYQDKQGACEVHSNSSRIIRTSPETCHNWTPEAFPYSRPLRLAGR